MKNKLCSTCREFKDTSQYNKKKEAADGLMYVCKQCVNDKRLNYSRTIEGLIKRIYTNQTSHSINRGHNKPKYTLKELHHWITTKDQFLKLYIEWINSNFRIELAPSIDRIINEQGYTFSNIRLCTWGDNKYKYYSDRSKLKEPILKSDTNGNVIKEYYSIKHAAIELGIEMNNIKTACNNNSELYGFIWSYKKKVLQKD